MNQFSFVMVLLSLIVGLGLTELLSNVARQIQVRSTTKPYWLHTCLVIFVFISLLQQWWEAWGLRSIETWNFPTMLFMLGAPIAIYIISHLLYPKEIEGTDFVRYYYEAPGVYFIGAIAVSIAVLFRPISFGATLLDVNNLSSAVLLVAFLILAITKNKIVHQTLFPLIFGAILLDIFVFSMNI